MTTNGYNQTYDYRGKRAVVLLRVSTEEQEKKYGFPAQLRSIREKLIVPHGLRIPNEATHIIRDTYTGMEFRERAELAKILEMARRREFDVLTMDVLDRLGRVGMPREIYRAELKMFGIHFLTTKEEEHADDDSMLGQMIRLWHGWKSEGERNDIIRRTQDGKRERVLKDHKLLGTNREKYGFKFKDKDKAAYVLDNDPLEIKLDGTILRDDKGEVWTKARIRYHMFKLVDEGWTIRGIAAYLTSKHIPTGQGETWDARLVNSYREKRHLNLTSNEPIQAYGYLTVLDENNNPYTETSAAQLIYDLDDKGMDASKIASCLNEKHVPTGKETFWHPATVSRMLTDEYVIGRAAAFVNHLVREPGEKPYTITKPREEWIYLPEGTVQPILVTEDGTPDIALFERVQQRLKENQKFSTRNNQEPHNYLLRAGFIKCGYCGGNMTTTLTNHNRLHAYRCTMAINHDSRCKRGIKNTIGDQRLRALLH